MRRGPSYSWTVFPAPSRHAPHAASLAHSVAVEYVYVSSAPSGARRRSSEKPRRSTPSLPSLLLRDAHRSSKSSAQSARTGKRFIARKSGVPGVSTAGASSGRCTIVASQSRPRKSGSRVGRRDQRAAAVGAAGVANAHRLIGRSGRIDVVELSVHAHVIPSSQQQEGAVVGQQEGAVFGIHGGRKLLLKTRCIGRGDAVRAEHDALLGRQRGAAQRGGARQRGERHDGGQR